MAGQMVPNHARVRQNTRRADTVFDCIQSVSAANHRIIASKVPFNLAAAAFCAAPIALNRIHVHTLPQRRPV